MKQPYPLLYISDGSIKSNGQLNRLDLVSGSAGYRLNVWRPAIAQYKAGGYWSDSPQGTGRRLAQRVFENAIEVMELKARSHDQDSLLAYCRELLQWQEAAADYWTSQWADRPVYLAARSAYETNTRYAVIHAMSIPELDNLYSQPFFAAGNRGAALEALTLRIERGHWMDKPPGESTCVEVSGVRSWTIQGWTTIEPEGDELTGDIRALVQANNGDIVLGSSDAAKIWTSDDDGITWTLRDTLGTSTDTVRAFTKDNAGNIYAAVLGTGGGQGIWRSTDNGQTWTQVHTPPSGNGYYDILFIPSGGGCIWAVAHSTAPQGLWSYSSDGVNWTDEPSSANYAYSTIAIAKPENDSRFFMGTDTTYTVVYSNVCGGTAVLAGYGQAMGAGGLDMAAFNFTDQDGRTRRHILWAVKSHLNTSNTEIWMHEPGGAAPYNNNFTKIATIAGENFFVLYPDPITGTNVPNRTIWAGAAGDIYVSYNNGFTWALATPQPIGDVYAILRTSSGFLLTGGASAELLRFAGNPGSEGGGSGGGTGGGGTVEGGTIVNSQPLGQEATCDEAVFVSNKSSFSNITHVLQDDGGSFTELQFANDPPYTLLPATPASNDAVYFGCKTSDSTVPSGTFSSIIFDITQVAEDVTITWEYWNGSSWATLTVQDNTDGFKRLGVGSVHYVVPGDWATTSVNSITGYWVRARVSAVGSAPVSPIHSNRYIYTSNLAYVEIDSDQVGGDIPALAQILWRNVADKPGSSPQLWAQRLLVGLRSLDRGEHFNAYINLSDKQAPFGVTLTGLSGGGTFADSVQAPTMRHYSVTYASSGDLNKWQDLIRITLSTTIARDYYGTFRAFVRGYVLSGDSDDWKVRLAVGFGSGGVVTYSQEAPAAPGNVNWRLWDVGRITIPNAMLGVIGGNLGNELTITVQGYNTTDSIALRLYDVILIPVDEWAGDFPHTNLLNNSIDSKISGGEYLDIDSITNPKAHLNAYDRQSTGLIKAIYQSIANGHAMLQTKRRQRLWFLSAYYTFSSGSWGADPFMTGTVRVNKVQRYLGPRGTA